MRRASELAAAMLMFGWLAGVVSCLALSELINMIGQRP